MNDLAEKALHGLDVVRRGIAARPVAALGAGGFAIDAVIVVTGARIGADPAAVPIDHWLGLLPAAGYRITGVAMGAVMLAAIGALIGLWLFTLRVSRVRGFGDRQLWMLAALWATPFVIGPPLLSTDIYGYVVHGLLARHGLSPYHHGPLALGNLRVVESIDPTGRSARSTDGPLASLGEHLAVSVSDGRVIPALLVLRVVAVLSVVVIGHLAADLAGTRRADALCLTIVNPAVLIFVVSAGHVAGVLGAVLIATLAAASQGRWGLAVVLVCIAAGLKPVALLVVPAVVAAHAIGGRVRIAWRIGLRDAGIAVATLAVVALAVPFGLGWITNLAAAARGHVPFAPSSLIADVIGFVVPSASYDDLAAGGRIATGVAGATVVCYLYATIRARPLEHTMGFALLAGGVLAPVLFPSSLLWGILCLAPTAMGARRDWVIALSCAACVLAPAGLGNRGGQYATIGALALIAVVLLPRLRVRHHNWLLTAGRVSVGD